MTRHLMVGGHGGTEAFGTPFPETHAGVYWVRKVAPAR